MKRIEPDTDYCIIQDDDGHYYITALRDKVKAEAWLEKAAKATEMFDCTGEFDVLPDYIMEIDGIHRLVFKQWKETESA